MAKKERKVSEEEKNLDTEDKIENAEEGKISIKKKERQLEKELLWIFAFLLVLIAVFLIASDVFQGANEVDYEGLTFKKERFGEIPVYHYSYLFRAPTGNLINYNMYLRVNPNENEVPVEGDPIKFNGRQVYITIDEEAIGKCEDASLAVGSLTNFFRDNQFIIKSGNMDFVAAATKGHEYVTCENKAGEGVNVVQIQGGENTRISTEGLCFNIEVGPDCQILEASEKFQVHAFLDGQNR